ncbi:MAG: helix-turn-helix transcriptional regulator [Anaerovoracaceae bacterium]
MTLEEQLRVARNLKALRRAAKLSQTQLAKEIRICRTTYCQYEQGDRLPDVGAFFSLAEFYQVRIDTLIKFDVQRVMGDYFSQKESTRDEQRLMAIYMHLSDFSRGRLIERAEQFAEMDDLKRAESFSIE